MSNLRGRTAVVLAAVALLSTAVATAPADAARSSVAPTAVQADKVTYLPLKLTAGANSIKVSNPSGYIADIDWITV